MNHLDDIDDLLRSFRADEARIDDAIRGRIWAHVCAEVPDAPTALDALDRGVRIRPLRPAGAPRRARVGALAAAVLVLLAAAGLAVRSGSSDDAVTAGPSTTIPVPRDLEELADRVAALPTAVLGETDGARYTYRRSVRMIQGDPRSEVSIQNEQRWVALDGSGREVIDVEGDARDRDETTDEAGAYEIGFLPPRTAVGLPDDADVVLATFVRDAGLGAGDLPNPRALLDLLTFTGLPGPARAGVLRALGRLGFEPVPGADPGPNLWRVEGPDPDGSTMQADLDLRTGEAVATAFPLPGGGFDRSTGIEVDLRRDTRGS